MEHRYRVLRVIATLYKVLAIVIGVITIIAAMGICVAGILGGLGSSSSSSVLPSGSPNLEGPVAAVFFSLVVLVYGALIGLGLYGFGELIMVGLAIEENTRGTYQEIMTRHAAGREAPPPPPSPA